MTSARYETPDAGESHWRIDSAVSKIWFEARWMFGMCTTVGVFERFGGWALLQDDGSLAGELTIEASSVNTGNRLRDRDLHNRFFLDSGNHPTITLAAGDIAISRSIAGTGQLSVRDRSAKVALHGTARVDAERLTLSGSANLDVRQFGWPTGFGYIRRSLVINGALSLDRRG